MAPSSSTWVSLSLAAAGGGLVVLLRRHQRSLWLKWQLLVFRSRLANVRVAVSTLGDDALKEKADDEGFVLCDVTLRRGKIRSVSLAEGKKKGLDCKGAILSPCFADSHTHAIKTETVARNRNPTGSITDALLAERDDLPRWADDGDIYRRARFALECAAHHGTKFLRTHLDGSVSDDPKVREKVWHAFETLRREFQGIIELQGVANLYLPLYSEEPDVAKAHCDDAKSRGGQNNVVVLGAYCGNVANEPTDITVAHFDALFYHARRLEMDVDLHVDETDDPKCRGLVALAESLGKARLQNGYVGRVVLGHCTALALQEDPGPVIHALAKLENVFVVANPSTNLGLQDRRGSTAPFSLDIPKDVPRTPRWRGITLIQELRAAGVAVAAASDNVRDHWHPYGDYDMLQVFASTVAVAHLDTAPAEGHWLDLVSATPARAMGLLDGQEDKGLLVAEGADADLVLFPGARRASELLARPQTDRIVLRRGRPQFTRLPDFADLDDLVQRKTTRTNLGSHGDSVTRGAGAPLNAW
mmetsp:Transcript_4556/g.15166  ORF Transcript_4556/g.15166 Transcript_4556/m.15166 type:complete len:530 (+) Transcript_4556:4518-6107(+)